MGSLATPQAPPAAAFELVEAAAARPSALDADGTCLIHIIRPGRGLGRGSHFYPAQMLQENAHVFTGWNVYVDHESPEARKARGYLPRSLHDVGGLIEESFWDGSVPAEGRFGQGAVVGRLRPIRDLKTIIAELPEAARFSIKAKATDVTEGLEDGHQVWVVEGIRDEPPGSVDAVTLDGAGGKVAALLEAQELDEHDLREAEEQLEHSRELAAEHKKDVQESSETPPEAEGGDTVKELEEALRDPDSEVSKRVKELAEAAAQEGIEAAKTELEESFEERVSSAVEERVEERVATEVEEARSEERAKAKRERDLRGMRDEAHRLIEEAELGSEKLTAKLKGQFDLEEGEPTDALDLVDQVDGDGNVVKSAKDQLTEAVEQELTEAREVLAEANPTEVTGQGGGSGGEGNGGGSAPAAKPKEKRYWREHMEESGVDPDEAFPGDKRELVEAGADKDKEGE